MPKLDPQHPWGTSDGEFACRPIFSRLPAQNYGYRTEETEELAQDPSNWLTTFPDEILCGLKTKFFNFYRDYLDCQTAKPEVLDWLAQLHGLTGEHWDPAWQETFKREMICHAIAIWERKGTEELMDWLIQSYGITTCTTPKDLWECENFIAGESRLDWPIKGSALESFIRVPLGNLNPKSPEWRLLARWIRLYMPAWSISIICYCYFYANHSRAGDGVFDHVLEQCQGLVPAAGENHVETFYLANSELAQNAPIAYFAGLLEYLAQILGLTGYVTEVEALRAGVSQVPATVLDVGNYPENPGLFWRVDPNDELYEDYGQTWRDRERLVQLYRPYQAQWEVNIVCHSYFRADISAPGHPVFDPVFEATIDAARAFYVGNEALVESDPIAYFASLIEELLTLLSLTATVENLGDRIQVIFELANGTEDAIAQTRRLIELYQPYFSDLILSVGYSDFYAGISRIPHYMP